MTGLVNTVLDKLGGGGIATVAGMLGVDEGKAKSAVGTAVTVLTGALAKNTSEPKGARSLDSALERDHDGGIFDDITGFLGGFAAGPGAGILGHVLGDKQPEVEQKIAEKSGLSLEKVVPLLVMVAPLVMGAIGKMKREEDLDAAGVAATLEDEKIQAEKDDDGLLGSIMGVLGGSDGDGLGGIVDAVGGIFGGDDD